MENVLRRHSRYLAPILEMKMVMTFDEPVLLISKSGLLTASYYGSLADRHGRRLILLLSSVGSLMMLIWMVAICMHQRRSTADVVRRHIG